MISFSPTEEQEIARAALRDFADRAVRPHARECDEESKISEEFLAQSWELGLISTQLPKANGGGGEQRSPVTNAIVLEELAYGDAALALAATAPAAFAFAIADQGTAEQRDRYLPLFCGADYHAASVALIEPAPVFDPLQLRTVAESRGDGFALSGRKTFVPLGDRASHFLVIARSGAALDAFIVPREAEGLRISEPERNLGLRALPTATLELERVAVPGDARLGGAAGCDVRRLLDHGRTALAAVMLGVSRAVLEYCVPYAKEREAFGEAIGRKQAIAFKLTDMHIEVEAMRWLVWKAASQLEKGEVARRSAHFARAYAAEKSMWIADNGVQVLGGHGFIREHPVEMWFRNARTLGVLEGTASL